MNTDGLQHVGAGIYVEPLEPRPEPPAQPEPWPNRTSDEELEAELALEESTAGDEVAVPAQVRTGFPQRKRELQGGPQPSAGIRPSGLPTTTVKPKVTVRNEDSHPCRSVCS